MQERSSSLQIKLTIKIWKSPQEALCLLSSLPAPVTGVRSQTVGNDVELRINNKLGRRGNAGKSEEESKTSTKSQVTDGNDWLLNCQLNLAETCARRMLNIWGGKMRIRTRVRLCFGISLFCFVGRSCRRNHRRACTGKHPFVLAQLIHKTLRVEKRRKKGEISTHDSRNKKKGSTYHVRTDPLAFLLDEFVRIMHAHCPCLLPHINLQSTLFGEPHNIRNADTRTPADTTLTMNEHVTAARLVASLEGVSIPGLIDPVKYGVKVFHQVGLIVTPRQLPVRKSWPTGARICRKNTRSRLGR
jgi:hypothetical protein